MLTREDIRNRLKEIFIGMDEKNRARVDRVTDSAKLVTDLGLNSIGILYMIIAIEETFDIRFDDAGTFVTLGNVVDYIEEHLK